VERKVIGFVLNKMGGGERGGGGDERGIRVEIILKRYLNRIQCANTGEG